MLKEAAGIDMEEYKENFDFLFNLFRFKTTDSLLLEAYMLNIGYNISLSTISSKLNITKNGANTSFLREDDLSDEDYELLSEVYNIAKDFIKDAPAILSNMNQVRGHVEKIVGQNEALFTGLEGLFSTVLQDIRDNTISDYNPSESSIFKSLGIKKLQNLDSFDLGSDEVSRFLTLVKKDFLGEREIDRNNTEQLESCFRENIVLDKQIKVKIIEFINEVKEIIKNK